MAGVFTTTRSIKQTRIFGAGVACRTSGNVLYPFSRDETLVGQETTTSYRSGGRYDEVSLTNAQILGNALNLQQSKWDTGHEFDTVKKYPIIDTRFHSLYGRNGSYYFGTLSWMYAAQGLRFYATVPDVNQALGAKAIASVSTAGPEGDLTDALLQLRQDGLPKLTGLILGGNFMNLVTGSRSQRERAIKDVFTKGISEENLNYQFGWIPFVSDLKQCLNAVLQSNKIVKQYIANSGKPVRRTFTFPTNVSSNMINDPVTGYMTEVFSDALQGLKNPNNIDIGYSFVEGPPYTLARKQIFTSTRQKTWFTGSMFYSLPVDNSFLGRFSKYASYANHILGLELTPDVLWDLLPWSWLADWMADIGTLIQNATLFSTYGQVMRYGYLMNHTTIDVHYMCSPQASGLIGRHTFSTDDVFRTERKQRVRATPFGFGLNVNSFSANQWAILGSLGLLKGPKLLP